MSLHLKNMVAGSCLAISAMAALPAGAETLDLMVLYTADALTNPNGRDINARIAAMVEWTNQAYRNSGADVQLRLVHTEQAGSKYNGLLTGTQLSWLTNDTTVNKLRQQQGADFVTMVGPSNAWCGLGYVPQGNGVTGQFNNGASNWAYNLVSISCSSSTFAHELGHNMALGHSNKQNSRGGVWDWARGHGESGRFVTIMGYTSAFNTNNRLQIFSNPNVKTCEGSACGVPRNYANGADSARNLNLLGSQLAGFMPTKHGAGNGGAGNGGGTTTALCKKPELKDNLIKQGDFNELNLWSAFFDKANLQSVEEKRSCGRDNRLKVTDRSVWYAGPVQDITSVIEKNKTYNLSLKARLGGQVSHRDTLQIALKVRDDSGTHYQYLTKKSITDGEYSELKVSFTPFVKGLLKKADILIYGPAQGEILYMDDVLLKQNDSAVSVALLNSDFEQNKDGWKDIYGATANISHEKSAAGNGSLKLTNRSAWYGGTYRDVKGIIEGGKEYQLNLDVLFSDARAGNQTIDIRALYKDNTGYHWVNLVRKDIASDQWTRINTALTLPVNGTMTMARIYLFGPDAGVDVFLDNIQIDLQ